VYRVNHRKITPHSHIRDAYLFNDANIETLMGYTGKNILNHLLILGDFSTALQYDNDTAIFYTSQRRQSIKIIC